METWKIIKQLKERFPIYPLPRKIVGSAYDDDELKRQKNLENITWDKLNSDLLEYAGLDYSLLTDEAHCYFTPGIFTVGINENARDLLVYGWFSSVFRPRNRKWRPEEIHQIYGSYSLEQLDIFKECFLWLGEDEEAFSAEDLKNCLDGVEELRQRVIDKSS